MPKLLKMDLVKSGFIAFAMLVSSLAQAADEPLFKPFVMAKTPAGDYQAAITATKAALTNGGFQIVGETSPYDGAYIFCVTNNVLLNIVKKEEFGSFAAVQRVSVANVKGKPQVAFTNPEYMAYAYRFKNNMKSVRSALISALGFERDFGAEGLTEEKLRDYNYAWGMEYFDDYLELAEHSTHARAVAVVEKNLKSNKVGAYEVYKLTIPGTKDILYGVGMKSPNMTNKYQDDGYIMGVIDFTGDKHLGHLPYEMLVRGNKIYALHARFRIAINFPDLSMAGENSFMNIMGAPGGIKTLLTKIAGGDVNDF